MCGNLASTISGHLTQVLFIPSMLSDNPATKSTISERSWKNFNQAEFVMDYFDNDWSNILNLKHDNVNVSMENLVIIGMIYLISMPSLKKSVNIN